MAECTDCLVPLVDELIDEPEPDHSTASFSVAGWPESNIRSLRRLLDGSEILFRLDVESGELTVPGSRAGAVEELVVIVGTPDAVLVDDADLRPERDDEAETSAGALGVADMASRVIAAIVDGVITGVAVTAARFVVNGFEFTFADRRREATFVIAVTGATFAYEALMTWRLGGTLGKIALRLTVCDRSSGDQLTGRAAALRAIVKHVAGISGLLGAAFQLVDCVPAFFDDRRRALHDRAASSLVVARPLAAENS
ncbi:MAG: RDD family protein [Actinobacteria bacterium]|nr:RDD family protein [Actinomycetota bacterium]